VPAAVAVSRRSTPIWPGRKGSRSPLRERRRCAPGPRSRACQTPCGAVLRLTIPRPHG
jgi:hypothetical protein